MKLLKLGTIALDGTKVHANASRHAGFRLIVRVPAPTRFVAVIPVELCWLFN